MIIVFELMTNVNFMEYIFRGGDWKNSGVMLRGQISRLPEQPYWIYALIALEQH